jgi:glyceraldehyde 3-phosphate dehydrogenase
MRIGLSGTGRIGRLFIRKFFMEHPQNLALHVINSSSPISILAHLLKYDSVHGEWDVDIQVEEGFLIINGQRIIVVNERSPDQLPWRELQIHTVVDATGKFNNRQDSERHLQAGAERVVITAPGKDMDLTVVMGVNEQKFDSNRHRLLSTASCTTNCIAPVLYILDEAFGVKQGWMTTVHAFTNDQNHLDNPHKDLRRARACTNSIIPTSTGVGKALKDVLPHLASHISGISVRVPVPDVSLLDLQVQLNRSVQISEVKEAFMMVSKEAIGKYVEYNELPLVSSDYIGNVKSAIIDGLSIQTREDQVKLLAWYDNEWAYTCRVYDFIDYLDCNLRNKEETPINLTTTT